MPYHPAIHQAADLPAGAQEQSAAISVSLLLHAHMDVHVYPHNSHIFVYLPPFILFLCR